MIVGSLPPDWRDRLNAGAARASNRHALAARDVIEARDAMARASTFRPDTGRVEVPVGEWRKLAAAVAALAVAHGIDLADTGGTT